MVCTVHGTVHSTVAGAGSTGLFQVPRLLLPLRACTQHSLLAVSHWSVDHKPELWLVRTSWPRPASHWPVPRGFWPLIGCLVAGLKLLHLAHTGHVVPETEHYINTRGHWHGQHIRLQRWEPLQPRVNNDSKWEANKCYVDSKKNPEWSFLTFSTFAFCSLFPFEKELTIWPNFEVGCFLQSFFTKVHRVYHRPLSIWLRILWFVVYEHLMNAIVCYIS